MIKLTISNILEQPDCISDLEKGYDEPFKNIPTQVYKKLYIQQTL